jgi:carboxyl-terminal processing protease
MIKIRNIVIILILLVLAFGSGYNYGNKNINNYSNNLQTITEKDVPDGKNINFSLFWEVWDRLGKYYIDKTKLDSQKMVYGAISGMVASLDDPYTVFLSPDQNKEAKDDLGGKFEGIGAQLGIKDKKIIVVAPLEESPAQKSGLLAGDWIIKVDDKDTQGWTLPEAVNKIRGPKGSTVNLTILHKDASVSSEIKIIRDTIKVASVEWKVKYADCNNSDNTCQVSDIVCPVCDEVIYLQLGRFGDNTTNEWNQAVSQIVDYQQKDRNKKIKGLIFDLRNNPGGYLSGSVFIASEFLKEGPVVYQQTATGEKTTYNVNRQGKLLTIPMFVLINKGSASASEIVAGALKDRERATLVGETTFGKGTIQEAQELREGAGIHITTAKWILPSNTWINGTGIKPDIEIIPEITDNEIDVQLQKAVESLIKNH